MSTWEVQIAPLQKRSAEVYPKSFQLSRLLPGLTPCFPLVLLCLPYNSWKYTLASANCYKKTATAQCKCRSHYTLGSERCQSKATGAGNAMLMAANASPVLQPQAENGDTQCWLDISPSQRQVFSFFGLGQLFK